MNHKLIMENWRHFVNENTDGQILEEGILSSLAGLVFVLNIGGKEIEVPSSEIIDAFKTAKQSQQMDAYEDLGNLIMDMSNNIQSGAIEPIDSDGDGIKEVAPLVTPDLGPEAIKLIQAELGEEPTRERNPEGPDFNGDGKVSPLELQKYQQLQRK